jgi:hypothetical protein
MEIGVKSSRNANYYLAAAVALMTLFVYLPALHNNFMEWDDGDYASVNLNIRSLDTSFSKWVFLFLQRATGTPCRDIPRP